LASNIIGFDIGDRLLKLACFVNGQLKDTFSVDVPEGMVSEGQVISADGMTELIDEVARTNNLQRKDAALVLPASLVYVRTVIVPLMNEQQLKYNLPYEFKDYLTEDKSKYVFDYEVLEVVKDDKNQPFELKLFVCAVLKDVIERYEKIFSRAGFNLKIAVPEEFVYATIARNALKNKTMNDGACAIIDIGESETRMHIMLNGEYDNKRTFDMGVKDIVNCISDTIFSDEHVAHNYMISNVDDVLNGDKCKDFYNALAVEILKASNFYNYNNRDYELKEVYLIGGGAAIEPLVSTIHEVANLNVHDASELISSKYQTAEPWRTIQAIYSAVEA